MFGNLNTNTDVAFLDLEKYFCNKDKCKFYKTKNSKTFSKKHDQHHLSLEASKDIAKILNRKLNQQIKKTF